MEVHIVILDDGFECIYEREVNLDVAPNIGEGILIDEDDSGFVSDSFFCEYAVCFEKYHVLTDGVFQHMVCKFNGRYFHRVMR